MRPWTSATVARPRISSDRTRIDRLVGPTPTSRTRRVPPRAVGGAGVPARRPVSRVLSRNRRGDHGDGHPSQADGYPPARAADPRTGQRASPPAIRVTPSYLALLRVELAAFHSVGRSRRHRHCGAGPRLAADGSYPLPCVVELGLSSRRTGCPAVARPSGRLADSGILPGQQGVLREHARAGWSGAHSGLTTTTAGPPAATLSMAAFASASATLFCALGT